MQKITLQIGLKNVFLIKELKILFHVSYCSYDSCGRNKLNVELNLSIYTTKSDLKKVTGVDAPDSSKKDDIPNLKPDVDKLNLDKLGTVPIDI